MTTSRRRFGPYQEVLHDGKPATVVAVKTDSTGGIVEYDVRHHDDGKRFLCSARSLMALTEDPRKNTKSKQHHDNQEHKNDTYDDQEDDGEVSQESVTDHEADDDDQEDELWMQKSLESDEQGTDTEDALNAKSYRKRPAVLTQENTSRKKTKYARQDQSVRQVSAEKPPPKTPTTPARRVSFQGVQDPILPKTPEDDLSKVQIGTRIDVYWQGEDKFFYATVTDQKDETTFHLEYDDGDQEWSDLSKEVFYVLGHSVIQTDAVSSITASPLRKILNKAVQPQRTTLANPVPATAQPAIPQSVALIKTPEEQDVCFLQSSKPNTQGTAEYRSLVNAMAQKLGSWNQHEVYSTIRNQLGQDRRFLIPKMENGNKLWQVVQEQEVKEKILTACRNKARRAKNGNKVTDVSSSTSRLPAVSPKEANANDDSMERQSQNDHETSMHQKLSSSQLSMHIVVPNQSDVLFLKSNDCLNEGTTEYRSLVKTMAEINECWSKEVYTNIREELGLDRRFLIPKSGSRMWMLAQEEEILKKIQNCFDHARSKCLNEADFGLSGPAVSVASLYPSQEEKSSHNEPPLARQSLSEHTTINQMSPGVLQRAQRRRMPPKRFSEESQRFLKVVARPPTTPNRSSMTPSRRSSPRKHSSSTPNRHSSETPSRHMSTTPGRRSTETPNRRMTTTPGRRSTETPSRCMLSSASMMTPGRRSTETPSRCMLSSASMTTPGRRSTETPSRCMLSSASMTPSRGSTGAIQQANIVEEGLNDSDVCFFAHPKANTSGTAEYRALVKDMARSYGSWRNNVYELIRDHLGQHRRFLIPTTDGKTGRMYWKIAREDEIRQKIAKCFGNMQQWNRAKKSTATNKTSVEEAETADDVPRQLVSAGELPTVNFPGSNESSLPRFSRPAKPSLSNQVWQSFMDFALEQIGLGKDDMAIWQEAKEEFQVEQNMSFYALTLIQALRGRDPSHLDWIDDMDMIAFASCLAKAETQENDTSPNVRVLLEEAFASSLQQIRIAREAPVVDNDLVASLNLKRGFLRAMLDIQWSHDLYHAIKDDGHEQHPGFEMMALKMKGAEPHFCRFLESVTRQDLEDDVEVEASTSSVYKKYWGATLTGAIFFALLWMLWTAHKE